MTLSNQAAAEAAEQPSAKPITNAVNALIRSLGPQDAAGEARAAIARNLAKKLDQIAPNKTGASVLAASRASRDLIAILDLLIDPSKADDAASLIARIFDND